MQNHISVALPTLLLPLQKPFYWICFFWNEFGIHERAWIDRLESDSQISTQNPDNTTDFRPAAMTA